MAKVKYDRQSNILSIRLSNKKSADSDIKNNVVLDYDKEGNLVNIDMMNVDIKDFNKAAKEKLKLG